MDHPLKCYRERSKVSKADLAKLAATSRQTIHRIEAWEQTPSLDLVRRLVLATGGKVSASDFIRHEVAA